MAASPSEFGIELGAVEHKRLYEFQPLAADANVGTYDAFGRKEGRKSEADFWMQRDAYCQQYRFWRMGGLKGCSTSSAPWGEQRASAVIVQTLR